MKYRLYTTSQKAWGGMFKAIQGSKESIYLEMYILSSDTNRTHNFFALLREKAKAGLEVVVIADSYGSWALKPKIINELKDDGVEFIFFSHWLKRTHRKILIVDKKIAFLGGVNIKEDSRNWKDLQIRIEGAPVKLLFKSFANSYRRCGGEKDSVLKYSYTTLSKKIKNWVLDNWPSTNKLYSLSSYYKKKISKSKDLIQIVSPYLLPPRWFLREIDNACQRGVRVEIIMPKNTDMKSLDKLNFINAHRLSRVGVKFFFGKQMNHAKLMLIDNKEVAIGSQNIDFLSFDFNYEAGIFSQQKDLVKDVSKIIEKWKKDSIPFKGGNKEMKFFDKIIFSIYKVIFIMF